MRIFTFIILTSLSLNLFSQTKKVEFTEKEFFDNSTFVDTIQRTLLYPNGKINKKEILCRIHYNNFNDTLLWYLERETYRKNGMLKKKISYSKDKIYWVGYDKNSLKSYEYTNRYEFDEPEKRILILNEATGQVKALMFDIDEIYYFKGKLLHRGKFHGKKGRMGTWEFFNYETGNLKRIKKYKDGKKIYDEKIITN